MHHHENIVLIGMPGAGKSTVGVVLAKALGMQFVDTDILIQERAGRMLQEILDKDGPDVFKRIEEEAILSLQPHRAVIATGGSVVFSGDAMAHLRSAYRSYNGMRSSYISRRLWPGRRRIPRVVMFLSRASISAYEISR